MEGEVLGANQIIKSLLKKIDLILITNTWDYIRLQDFLAIDETREAESYSRIEDEIKTTKQSMEELCLKIKNLNKDIMRLKNKKNYGVLEEEKIGKKGYKIKQEKQGFSGFGLYLLFLLWQTAKPELSLEIL